MKKLLIISTGGTIGQARDEKTGASVNAGAADAVLFAERLKPELDEFGYEVFSEPALAKDSSNVVPEDWVKIVDLIEKNYDAYDSFLVTHGTNTLSFTCSALSFALGGLGKRVVLTGSQVPSDASGSDALMNLQNAARVAMTDQQPLVGVMAVFGSKIISGARVKKRTEFDYDGFESHGNVRPIGQIGRIIKFDEAGLEFHMNLHRNKAKTKEQLDIIKDFSAKVVHITETPGMPSNIFEILVDEAKVQGFMISAVGAGDPNVATPEERDVYSNLRPAFEWLQSRKIPVVITTQAPNGVASMDINPPGVIASGLGAIPGWDMSPEAMYVKLVWLLGQNLRYDQYRSQMLLSYRGEILVGE